MVQPFQVLRGGRSARTGSQQMEFSTEAKFEDLVLTHLDALFAFAMRLVAGRRDQAEDLVRQTCLRSFQAYADLRSPEKSRPWFFRILTL